MEVFMGKVVLDMAMSLDGFAGGLTDEDIGLYDWYFAPSGDAPFVIDELLQSTGAMIMGRGAFGDEPDGFDTPSSVPRRQITRLTQSAFCLRQSGTYFVCMRYFRAERGNTAYRAWKVPYDRTNPKAVQHSYL
jgi:hypothetical protein